MTSEKKKKRTFGGGKVRPSNGCYSLKKKVGGGVRKKRVRERKEPLRIQYEKREKK